MTLQRLADLLRRQLQLSGLSQQRLRMAAGISKQTLTNVLSGSADYKVTTLLAVAEKLGLEVVLVPKGAAEAVHGELAAPPAVRSRVQAALEQVGPGSKDEKAP